MLKKSCQDINRKMENLNQKNGNSTLNPTIETSELKPECNTSEETTNVVIKQAQQRNPVVAKEERPKRKVVMSEVRKEALRDPIHIARMRMGRARAMEIRKRLLEGETIDQIDLKPPQLKVEDFVKKAPPNKSVKVVEPMGVSVVRSKSDTPIASPRGCKARKPKVVYLTDSDSSSDSSADSREVIFKKKKKTRGVQQRVKTPPAPQALSEIQKKRMAFINQIMNQR